MSKLKLKNPYAFPCERDEPGKGMTLRDYFAAKVITGAWQNTSPGSQSELAKRAYEIADAMLNQREK